MSDELIGKVLGKCRLERKLGEGGMGVVYLGRHQTTQAEVAVKVLPPELARIETWRERFMREARIAARLSHPNAVRVHDVDAEDDHHYLVMDLVRGRSLGELLEAQGTIPWRQAVRYAHQACAALQAAHALGIVHRDIKPDNLMLDQGGAIKVTDFGLARDVEASELSVSGQISGSPAYMSPEQAEGQTVTVATDVFSLGVTLHTLVAGSSPFKRNTLMASLHAVFEEPLPPLPGVPAQLAGLLQAMTHKRAEQRPPLEAVATALAALEEQPEGVPVSADEATFVPSGGADQATLVQPAGGPGGAAPPASASGDAGPPAPRRRRSASSAARRAERAPSAADGRRASRSRASRVAPSPGRPAWPGPLVAAAGLVVTLLVVWLLLRPPGGEPVAASSSSTSSSASPRPSSAPASAVSRSLPEPAVALLAEIERLTHRGALAVRAERQIERLAELAPEHPTALLWVARLRNAQRQPAAALVLADRVLRERPADVDAHYQRGQALRLLDRDSEAARSFARALEHDATHLPSRLARAQLSMEAGRVEEARRDLDLAVARRSAMGCYYRAKLRLTLQDDPEGALEDCEQALARMAGSPLVRRLQLDALLALERWQAVLELVAEAEREGRPLRDVSLALGHACRGLGRQAEALRHYQAALSRQRTPAGLLGRGELLLAKGDAKAAERDARSALALRADADGHALLGRCLAGRGRKKEAGASFEQALALDPQHAGALAGQRALDGGGSQRSPLMEAIGQAQLAYKQEDYSATIKACRRALELDPKAAMVQWLLGDSYLERQQSGDASLALIAYTAALELNASSGPKHHRVKPAKVMVRMAMALLQLDRNEEAIRRLQRALEIDPGIASARLKLVKELHYAARFEEAKQAADALRRLPKQEPHGHYWRGRAQLGAGDLAAAIADFRAAAAKVKDPAADYALGCALLLAGEREAALAALRKAGLGGHGLAVVMLWVVTGDRSQLEPLKGGKPSSSALLRYARGELDRATTLRGVRWAGGDERTRGWLALIDEQRKPGSGRAGLQAVAKRFGRVHWIAIWAARERGR